MADAIKADHSSRDSTTRSRTVVITIDRPTYRPADRLYQASVTLVADGFQFSGYEAAATDFTTIDVESLDIRRESDAGAELNPSFGGALSVGKLSIASEKSSNESAAIRERAVTNVKASPGKIVVYRKGAVGFDLLGNILIKVSAKAIPSDVDFVAKVSSFKLMKDDVDLDAAKATLNIEEAQFIVSKPLTVCAKLDYVDREVVKGEQFYDESKHSVRANQGTTGWTRFLLIPEDEVAPTLWALVDGSGVAIAVETAFGPKTINFTSPLDAVAFAKWVDRVQARVVGTDRLYTHDAQGRPVAMRGSVGPLVPTPNRRLSAPSLPPCVVTPAEEERAGFSAIQLSAKVTE